MSQSECDRREWITNVHVAIAGRLAMALPRGQPTSVEFLYPNPVEYYLFMPYHLTEQAVRTYKRHGHANIPHLP